MVVLHARDAAGLREAEAGRSRRAVPYQGDVAVVKEHRRRTGGVGGRCCARGAVVGLAGQWGQGAGGGLAGRGWRSGDVRFARRLRHLSVHGAVQGEVGREVRVGPTHTVEQRALGAEAQPGPERSGVAAEGEGPVRGEGLAPCQQLAHEGASGGLGVVHSGERAGDGSPRDAQLHPVEWGAPQAGQSLRAGAAGAARQQSQGERNPASAAVVRRASHGRGLACAIWSVSACTECSACSSGWSRQACRKRGRSVAHPRRPRPPARTPHAAA